MVTDVFIAHQNNLRRSISNPSEETQQLWKMNDDKFQFLQSQEEEGEQIVPIILSSKISIKR